MAKLKATEDFDERMSTLSYNTFDISHDYGNTVTSGAWMRHNKTAHLYTKSAWSWIGGITINVDGPASDMFLPLTFGIEYANGTIVDLMAETFGEEA